MAKAPAKTSGTATRVNDIFDSNVVTHESVQIDERSAIIYYSITPNANFDKDYQAANIKLEVDLNSVPKQMTVGEPGSIGSGSSPLPDTWHPMGSSKPTMYQNSSPETFQIEIKTGVFAALEINGSQTPPVTAATINQDHVLAPAAKTNPSNPVQLKVRIVCEYHPITPLPPTRVQDPEYIVFAVRD